MENGVEPSQHFSRAVGVVVNGFQELEADPVVPHAFAVGPAGQCFGKLLR